MKEWAKISPEHWGLVSLHKKHQGSFSKYMFSSFSCVVPLYCTEFLWIETLWFLYQCCFTVLIPMSGLTFMWIASFEVCAMEKIDMLNTYFPEFIIASLHFVFIYILTASQLFWKWGCGCILNVKCCRQKSWLKIPSTDGWNGNYYILMMKEQLALLTNFCIFSLCILFLLLLFNFSLNSIDLLSLIWIITRFIVVLCCSCFNKHRRSKLLRFMTINPNKKWI